MSFWYYVAPILTLPRLLYRLLHEGKPYSDLPQRYHFKCRALDSLFLWGFFALMVVDGLQAKWKAALFWLVVYPFLCWFVKAYTASRATRTGLVSIKIAFPEMPEEKFDPKALSEVGLKRETEFL